jgi:hypothetical protein
MILNAWRGTAQIFPCCACIPCFVTGLQQVGPTAVFCLATSGCRLLGHISSM